MRPSIVNASTMLHTIAASQRLNDSYVVANFFSSSCPYSAEFSPIFEALPQVFDANGCTTNCKMVQFLAFDAHADRQLNRRYGIGGYPTVVCFSRGRLLARYNDKPSLQSLIDFVVQQTNSTTALSARNVQLKDPGGLEHHGTVDPALHWVLAVVGMSLLHIFFDLWRTLSVRRHPHDKDQ